MKKVNRYCDRLNDRVSLVYHSRERLSKLEEGSPLLRRAEPLKIDIFRNPPLQGLRNSPIYVKKTDIPERTNAYLASEPKELQAGRFYVALTFLKVD